MFADIDDTHLLLDPESARAAITPRTKAIVVTHLYGRMADMQRFRELADRNGIKLFEDCAQAHGARRNGRLAGSWGDAASFSFYPTKNLGALGDGGLVATNDADIGRAREASAPVRLGQEIPRRRRACAQQPSRRNAGRRAARQAAACSTTATRAVARSPHATPPFDTRASAILCAQGEDYVAHLYVLRTDARDALRQHLDRARHRQRHPLSRARHATTASCNPTAAAKTKLPVSERAVQEILTLPCYPELTDEEVSRICEALAAWEP